MKCDNCGFDSPYGMRYCGRCGTLLAHTCPVCGFANPGDFLYCGMCGSPLVTQNRASVHSGSEEVIPSGVPAHANDVFLESLRGNDQKISIEPFAVEPEAIELAGERRVATVLLADVFSSTNLLELIGSESWVQIMNQVFLILEREINLFGGKVDQFRGDGLVAFFGAEIAHEDDPERAVLAGMRMQGAMEKFSHEMLEKDSFEVKLRVGINTGEVIITSVGDTRQHPTDTAMGEAVAIAARMETSAEPGTVLVSSNTHRLVERSFEWLPMGDIQIKGVSRPVQVYRPLRHIRDLDLVSDDISSRLALPSEQNLPTPTKLARPVGREAEYATLQHALLGLQNGRGGIILVTGEKGSGKTFLVRSARQVFEERGLLLTETNCDELISPEAALPDPTADHYTITWLSSNCRSYQQAWPLSIWRDLFQKWIGRCLDETPQNTRMRLQAMISGFWEQENDLYYPYLATFLSLPVEEAYQDIIKPLNAATIHDQFFIALKAWLEVLADQGPLVIGLNDLQWADQVTINLIKYCLPLSETKPLLWVLTCRPERASPVWDLMYHIGTEYPHRLTMIDLAPLKDEHSRELIYNLIGPGVLSERTMELLIAKAEGNAYYLRELLEMLVSQGVLTYDLQTSAWRENKLVTSLDLPDSLQTLLQTSIDRLKPEDRRVLQIAAVIGTNFWRVILEYLVGSHGDLSTSINNLLRKQFIDERPPVPGLGTEYVFTPLLMRDVAYESLLSSQRITYHRQVANFMENSFKLEDFNEASFSGYDSMIAYHYSQAGEYNKEYYYTLNAAAEARKIFANDEALELYSRGLELLKLLEDQTNRLEPERQESRNQAIRAQRFEALNERMNVYFSLGRVVNGNNDAKELLRLAELMPDDPFWMIDALLSQPEVNHPDNHSQLVAGQQMAYQALDLAQRMHDQDREMKSLILVSSINFLLHHHTWRADAERALELSRQLGDRHIEARLLLKIGGSYGVDNLEIALQYLKSAQQIIQELDDKYAEMELLRATGEQYERKGDYYRQLSDYEEHRLNIARQVSNRLSEAHALMFCGQVRAIYLGDLKGGLEQVQETARIYSGLSGRLFPLLRTAQIQVMQGYLAEAEVTLAEADQLSAENIMEFGRAGYKLVRAILNNALGKEDRLREVLDLGRETEWMAAEDLVSRQYLMASACEMSTAYLKLAELSQDEAANYENLNKALESSGRALELFERFGFVQIAECTSEEILYRHSLALRANNRTGEADEYLSKAYIEMMRKHAMIPAKSHFRKTYLENIPLHKEIRERYQRYFGKKNRTKKRDNQAKED